MPPKSTYQNFFEITDQYVQCRVCMMDELRISLKRARDSDAPEPCVNNNPGVGRFAATYNNTNAKGHLTSKHSITDEQCENARSFFTSCSDMKDRYGWGTFGCVLTLRESMKNHARANKCAPLENRIVLYLASSYTSFAQVESKFFQNLYAFETEQRTFTRQFIRNHALKMSKLAQEKFLRKHAGKIAKLTIDVGTVWNRYVGVCIHIKNEHPFVLCLLDDRTVVKEAMKENNFEANRILQLDDDKLIDNDSEPGSDNEEDILFQDVSVQAANEW